MRLRWLGLEAGAQVGSSTTQASFLSAGGELGALIRAHDWAATPIGPAETWPHSLKLAIRIMLTSRQPFWIGWGTELLFFYNDPYKSIIGGKHPWALGRPTAEVWREIWDDIGPLLETAMRGDQGTFVESQLLIMQRYGYPEETYYTFSYSPIPNDDGSVGGIICANSDDTQRVIGERQLALLRELAAETASARTWREACEKSCIALGSNPRDLPFAMIYMAEPESDQLSLVGSTGIDRGHPAAPELVERKFSSIWPFEDVLRKRDLRLVSELRARSSAPFPGGPWGEPPDNAAVIPILPAAETGRSGVLIAGLNPYRRLDEDYRTFLGLVANQIGSAVANAQSYEEERRRAEALAEIDRAKTTFFSNVSHEFRTPLTLLLGPLEDALNDSSGTALPREQRDRLQIAQRNGLRLQKLVNSLLDFSRIEAGRFEANFESTDLCALTANLASNFQSAMEKAGLQFKVDCAPLPGSVFVDRDMWEKIILNLLSNALKFTFEGEVAIELRQSQDRRCVELAVRDTGVGIPAAELPRLFERFHRVEGQKSRSFEGSGIGLALVHELVRFHGGTVHVESEVNKGSTFHISIPLGNQHLPHNMINTRRTQTSTSSRAESFVEEATGWLPVRQTQGGETANHDSAASVGWIGKHETGRQKILIADDNADMRQYISRLLGVHWRVECVSDGMSALAALRREKPDLLLTDVMMPGMDGFGLLREIRGDPELRDLAVILLTARAGETERIEGLDASADDYLTKPFSAKELTARVGAHLALARLRREAVRTALNNAARLRRMFEEAPSFMGMLRGPLHMIELANASFHRLAGHRELVGKPIREAFHDLADQGFLENLDEVFRTGRTFVGNSQRVVFKIGEDSVERFVDFVFQPIADAGDAITGIFVEGTDATERVRAETALRQTNEYLELRVSERTVELRDAIARLNIEMQERQQAEESLRQAQKMEAVGKLTGGVAHDFNNVLQIIGGNLQLLARDVSGNVRAEQHLHTALVGVSRGSKLASQLLAFGRRQPLSPKVVNLGRLVRDIDAMLRRAIGEAIEVETVIAGGLWNTYVDSAQVENALLNLAINARDAMQGQGKLTIELGNASIDDDYAARIGDVVQGQYVMLAVTDTGCGIAPDVMEHVFEPFFTTKPEGQGTGLGLSMVYGFVKQSGGHIKIYSELDKGTTVRLYLPRAKQAEDIEIETRSGPATGGTETILVVEDDEDVRGTVVAMLCELGYRVLKARDAQSALSVIESGVPIDLLFTDVIMPGMLSSPDLARKARERIPDIAVLFTSGYTENAVVHGGRLDEGIDLLSKPYTRESLARRLRLAFDSRQQRKIVLHSFAPHEGPKSGSSNGAPADARVLLVEDDPLIRMSTADMLVSLGYSVLEASDGLQALKCVEEHDIDILLTDVSLPNLSGTELAQRAMAIRPGLSIVFASGFGGESARDAGFDHAAILTKPFNAAQLADVLRSAATPASRDA
jgi:signal transduction histidine kinase/DNA-binding response OmpR family regulator